MNPIEQAYKAWRATAKEAKSLRNDWERLLEQIERAREIRHRPPTPTERARHAVRSYWATLTPEQRSERQRKAARKMWKRRKAEAR